MRTFSRGFTVIEVLVAIALTMVIGWLVSLAFNNASQACRGVTATLDYRAKGAAILDMLESDIANTSQYCKSVSPTSTKIEFKTVLPRQRSHYHSGATFDTSQGDYYHNIVSVRWECNPGDPDHGYPSSLYRKVSSASSATEIPEAFDSYKTAMASVDCYADVGAWHLAPTDSKTPDFAKNSGDAAIGDYLVTHTDIRNFDVVKIGTEYDAKDGAGDTAKASVVGKIPAAYRVSFFLTNAPANVKSPRDVHEMSEGEAQKQAKEELAAYIWEYFDRTIATR